MFERELFYLLNLVAGKQNKFINKHWSSCLMPFVVSFLEIADFLSLFRLALENKRKYMKIKKKGTCVLVLANVKSPLFV